MSFSYSGDPSNSAKDEVRFLLGDTDANAALINDNEINYLVTKEGTPLAAAIAGAIGLAAKYSRKSDESVGEVSKSYSQISENYRKLAKDLRQRNAENAVCPYAGGLSVSEKKASELDTDKVDPAFRRDLHDNPRSSGYVDNPKDDDCY